MVEREKIGETKLNWIAEIVRSVCQCYSRCKRVEWSINDGLARPRGPIVTKRGPMVHGIQFYISRARVVRAD